MLLPQHLSMHSLSVRVLISSLCIWCVRDPQFYEFALRDISGFGPW